MSWTTPPIVPTVGDDHCPCRILSKTEFPELLAGQRFIATNPTVALRVNELDHAADRSDCRRRPLSVQDPVENRIIFPHEFAGVLVNRNDRRRFWRRDVDVTLVLTVRSEIGR